MYFMEIIIIFFKDNLCFEFSMSLFRAVSNGKNQMCGLNQTDSEPVGNVFPVKKAYFMGNEYIGKSMPEWLVHIDTWHLWIYPQFYIQLLYWPHLLGCIRKDF